MHALLFLVALSAHAATSLRVAPVSAPILRAPPPWRAVRAVSPNNVLNVEDEVVVDEDATVVEDASPKMVSPAKKPVLSLAKVPGLAIAGIITAAATDLGARTALSPLMWAVVIGMSLSGLWPASAPRDGIAFAKARLLRTGIVLYGVKLTVQQIAGIGLAGLLLDLFTVSSSLTLGVLLGRALKIDAPLAALISTGAAICGCSAVVAAQPVVDGEAHEVAAAVGTVVLCGTSAMFLYPLLYSALPFLSTNPQLMGLYTGASVHELAGVVAAGAAMGPAVSATAIVTKLVRVCMLAPALVLMSRLPSLRTRAAAGGDDAPANAAGRAATTRAAPPLPWFALGFVAVAALNSVVPFDRRVTKLAGKASATCLAMAMAALGLDTDFGKIRKLGPRPLVLAAALWAWLLLGVGSVARFLVAVLA